MTLSSKSIKLSPPDISEILKKEGADAYLLHGNIHDSDIYYATRFLASDPFSYILFQDLSEILLVSDMEKGRADNESRISAENIKTTSDYDFRGKIKTFKNSTLAYAAVLKEMMEKENVKKVAVSYDFPAFYFDRLKNDENGGIDVVLIQTPFEKNRSVKSDREIE
ncbi:aminopeptidase P family N-terminal domain-containing protein [Methanolapillus ohkumae]|uniref:Creatinase N-terminal domain-containing protein n=1 Tax=Methanolapillus ohkumae TaxID=3028298 RepID=A0AA96ZV38_9EURY|nr:hypothetical protein MsAm2_00590 [Methanosarcinaceae archaeon Am2]